MEMSDTAKKICAHEVVLLIFFLNNFGCSLNVANITTFLHQNLLSLFNVLRFLMTQDSLQVVVVELFM